MTLRLLVDVIIEIELTKREVAFLYFLELVPRHESISGHLSVIGDRVKGSYKEGETPGHMEPQTIFHCN